MRASRSLLCLSLAGTTLATAVRAVHAADDDPLLVSVAKFLSARTPDARRGIAAEIVKSKSELARVAALLAKGRAYAGDAPKGWLQRSQRCADGKDRPYLLYVPESYDPAKRHRLVLELHGGVSRPVLLTFEELEQVKGLRGEHAEANGYFLALPTGESKAEWWTEVGASNALGIVAATKLTWNIDENLVLATGFSDGGSGSYYLALAHPTPFAGFVPLNGHVGVAAAGGLEVHLRGLRNKPVYAVNTDQDSLYPSASLKPVADALSDLRAPFTWREIKGIGHDPSYLATEREAIWTWEQSVRRVPHPTTVHWEGAPGAPSRVHGLGHVTVAAVGGLEPFPDVNPVLPPGRVKLGIVGDTEFAGPGVRVAQVSADSVAKAAGLAVGDVIVGLDDTKIETLHDLRGALGGKRHGDPVRVRVRRDDAEIEKKGTFPEAKSQPAFQRGSLRGTIEVAQAGNQFTVKCGNVSDFELWFGVGAVDFATPVVVLVNGAEAHRGVVAPDVAFLLERAAEDDDRTMLYGARSKVTVAPRSK